jgi:hypothetical protein
MQLLHFKAMPLDSEIRSVIQLTARFCIQIRDRIPHDNWRDRRTTMTDQNKRSRMDQIKGLCAKVLKKSFDLPPARAALSS